MDLPSIKHSINATGYAHISALIVYLLDSPSFLKASPNPQASSTAQAAAEQPVLQDYDTQAFDSQLMADFSDVDFAELVCLNSVTL